VPEAAIPPPEPPRRDGRTGWFVIGAVALVVAIVAGVVVSTRQGTDLPATPSGSVAPSPVLSAPGGLVGSARGFSVTLTWSPSTGTVPVGTYNVYRNERLLGSVQGTQTTYSDTSVVPGRSYTYEVLAHAESIESQRATVQVKVAKPSLRAARVEGTFNVKATATSHSGYTQFTGSFTTGWKFRPKCDTGACNVVWQDLAAKGFKATLKDAKGKYTGSDTGNFNAKCGSSNAETSLSISFTVAKAKAGVASWDATKLTGTLTQTEDAQLGCVRSTATYTITASLIS
jgi:hypothetical protein